MVRSILFSHQARVIHHLVHHQAHRQAHLVLQAHQVRLAAKANLNHQTLIPKSSPTKH